MNTQDRLNEILSTMDVPLFRKTDLQWLNRNIRIRNGEHPDIKECCNLITELLLEKGFRNANYIMNLQNKGTK